MADLYATLNISRNATPDEIKKSFRKLAVENHPDKYQGCKEKEEKFKSINQAYSILSDPQKRSMYDQYGTIDDQGPQMSPEDILKSVFGNMGMGGMPGMPGMGGGIPGMPGGFSFMFVNDGMAQMPQEEDIFAQIFGARKAQPKQDVVEVGVDINDIYYGNNKRVEFEILELCQNCQGSGASDPTQIIKCLTCKGQGKIVQQIGPFLNELKCPSCQGNGSAIKRVCSNCKGQKTVYLKKAFDLRLPKGIPNDYEVRMNGRGSYNMTTKSNKDMVFKFKHNIQAPYKLDNNLNVILTIPITIEELVAGFQKKIKLYRDDVVFQSDKYFNPNNPIILKTKGIHNLQTNESTDLHLKFEIEYVDSDKLSKYKDIFHKIFKRTNIETNDNIIDIHGE
jgi:molecular chaperone DnaJ